MHVWASLVKISTKAFIYKENLLSDEKYVILILFMLG